MAIAVLLAALVVLPLILARDSARDRRRRGDWFAPVLPLLDAYRVTQEGKGWPVLTGRYRGRDVRLEPVLDDMAWRKLPSLWLKATLLSPNSSRGTLGFLVRARGGEFYSPTAEMSHRLPLPSGWPRDALLCTDDKATAPLDLDMSVFGDPRMKELVITPKGVRLVYQAAQGSRAEYLVLRQARFAESHADLLLVRSLLDHVLDIAASADAGSQATVAA
jgi:hypothetical protein